MPATPSGAAVVSDLGCSYPERRGIRSGHAAGGGLMLPALVVGRESEIDSVHDFLEAVPGGLIALLIEGEIGIGKTTLWREGTAEAGERGLQVLTSRPVEAEIALPFAVLGDLLGDVPDSALKRLPDPQREALEVALLRAGTKPGGLQRRAVALGVLGAIRVLAEDTPLVWPIDDAQWLDPPSPDALAFAARRLRDEPIGFLLARRAEASEKSRLELETALDSDRLTRLAIGPLDIRSLDRLLRAQRGMQFLRPALVELQRVSGGNPFFALELGRALLTRDVSPAPGEPLPVPATLNELVRERLAGIPTAAREAALVVSALARPTVELVAAAAGGGGGAAALGSHIRCSPRSSTRRHRRLGDANCTPAWRRSSTIRTSRRSISPSLRAVPMPRWPRPWRMLPDGQEHVALRKPQLSSGTGHECSRRPMTPTRGGGRSKPGSAISRRGTPTGRDFCSKKWWHAFLRVASAPSRSPASLGSEGGSGMAGPSPWICSALLSPRSETTLRR